MKNKLPFLFSIRFFVHFDCFLCNPYSEKHKKSGFIVKNHKKMAFFLCKTVDTLLIVIYNANCKFMFNLRFRSEHREEKSERGFSS